MRDIIEVINEVEALIQGFGLLVNTCVDCHEFVAFARGSSDPPGPYFCKPCRAAYRLTGDYI